MAEKTTTKELRQLAKGFGVYCKSDSFNINNPESRKDWEALSYIRCELLKRRLNKTEKE